jgi:predicted ArsR family transcriptional regulator
MSLCALFGERAEVIHSFARKPGNEESGTLCEDILALVARRPCSVEDIASGLMLNRMHVLKHLEDLVSKQLVTYTLCNGCVYYQKG